MRGKNTYKKLFSISLFINVILITALFLSLPSSSTQSSKPYSKSSSIDTQKHFCQKDLLFNGLDTDSSDIVFTGDSFIDNFPLTEMFNNSKIRNRGIQGEFSAGLLQLVPVLMKGKPSKIFIYIGINDVIFGVSSKVTIENYRKIILKMKRLSTATKIHIISILPIRNNSSFCIDCNDEIEALNKQIELVAEEHRVEYISITTAFIKNGQINKDLVINDGLHLNFKGYLKFKQLLQPYLK